MLRNRPDGTGLCLLAEVKNTVGSTNTFGTGKVLQLNIISATSSSAENNGKFKCRALADGLSLNNYQLLNALASSGMNTPVL